MLGHTLLSSNEIACVTLPHFLGLHDLQIYRWSNMCRTIWNANCDSRGMFKISKPNCIICGQMHRRTLCVTSMPPWRSVCQFASMLERVQPSISVCTILHIVGLINNVFALQSFTYLPMIMLYANFYFNQTVLS